MTSVVLLWHAPPNPFEPPILAPGQRTGILENYYKELSINDKNTYFPIPYGEFDLKLLLKELLIPSPDFIFVCIDATLPYYPRNISEICNNTFLVLGDTHHMVNPITRLLQYVQLEKYAGHIFTNNIRHAHWFSEVCNAEQFFEPGLFAVNFKITEKIPFNQRQKLSPPFFYGQMGIFHPRRKRLMTPLLVNNRIRHVSGSIEEIAAAMKTSIACVNITLNADLNSRIFEIAQNECLLIIDQISIQNGFGSVLIPHHNCISFDNQSDLIDILNDTDYLLNIGPILAKNLMHEYNTYWGIECIRQRLIKTISSGSIQFNKFFINPRKKLETSLSIENRLLIYEKLLEIHRTQERILILIESENRDAFEEDLKDLPRIQSTNKDELIAGSIYDRYYLIENNATKIPELFSITN